MRARSRFAALSFAMLSASLALACGSSSSDGGTTGGDTGTGGKDTSSGDTSGGDSNPVKDTSTTPTDSTSDGASDTPKSDGGGLTACDPHPGDECNMVKQDCAAIDETCEFDSSKGHNTCQKLTVGTVGKGEKCDSATNPCDRGLFCYSGKCSPACCPGDNSVCGGSGICNLSITAPGDAGDVVLYHTCTYSDNCHPFKYDCPTDQVCLFSEEPDVFACSTPSTSAAYSAAPGINCLYANDCGESQACFNTKGTDAASDYKCYLFCYMGGPEAGSVGTDAKGRFAANGTCTVGGKSYGTCTTVPGIGGGLGICIP
jgi:hypothetical protein